jgi:hypothetical protein
MACSDCSLNLNRYSPACLECGRRYLAAIKREPIPEAQKVAWLRKALADWKLYGHAEEDLRERPCAPASASAAANASTPSGRRKSSVARTAQ